MSQIHYAAGRRNSSAARVYLSLGSGKITVNDRPLDTFFGRETSRMVVRQPLETVSMLNRIDVKVSVTGGGNTGQAGAIRHGITRALLRVKDEFREPLKKAGLITRDSRSKERKKYGQKGARRRFQYSKR